jgi:hypothetical protein
MTRPRLSVLLAGINVAVAAVLLRVAYTRPLREWTPVPWESYWCYTINAPANLFRNLVSSLWEKHVYARCSAASAETCIAVEKVVDIGVFLLAVGLIWYVVGLEIESRGQMKRAIVPSATLLRAIVDIVLVLAGVFIAFILLANLAWFSGHRGHLSALFVLDSFCYLAWALAFGIPYGHDLVKCIAQRRRAV